jgi:D-arabinose 1-dehydrogenase-like Zn-dependent alcohol dehydrogenase
MDRQEQKATEEYQKQKEEKEQKEAQPGQLRQKYDQDAKEKKEREDQFTKRDTTILEGENPLPEVSHPLYPKASPDSADGVAWLFYNKDSFGKYYYKLPVLCPKDVRIRSLYAGLCHSDCMEGRNLWDPNMFPLCPGHEIIGEVYQVGTEVKSVKVGDKVAFGPLRDSCGKCAVCVTGDTEICREMKKEERFIYGKYFGGWASHQQHPESHCFKLPSNLDLASAAPLLCAGGTVYKPMAEHLKKGDKVVVFGVGGLGHLAIQYAVKMGITVDALEHVDFRDKESYCKKIGASDVHLWKDRKCFEELKETYDAIIHTSSIAFDPEMMDALLQIMKPRGKLLLLGLPPNDEKFQFTYLPAILGEYRVFCSCCAGKRVTQEMLKFTADNKIEVLCEHFSFEEFPKALNRLEKEVPKFRCVVDMDTFTKTFPRKA